MRSRVQLPSSLLKKFNKKSRIKISNANCEANLLILRTVPLLFFERWEGRIGN